ncbi:MAG: alpha-1,2-fucosyltransferase [Aquabacterium sp.]
MGSAIVLIRGGLGNQMFQVAYGLVLAQRYGVTVGHVDFSKDARVSRDWGLSVFGIQQHPLSPARWALLRYALIAARKVQNAIGWARPFGIQLEPESGGAVSWPTRAPWLADGYWQQVSYYLEHLPLLRRQFQVDLGAYDQQGQLLRMKGRPVVAMHARRGDYVSDPAAAMHLVCDVAYYQRAWQRMAARLERPILWVFSDDPDWARAHLNFGPDTEFAHSEAGQPVWVDMMRMATCDHFIISNSSYSWWAAMLACHADKQVIAPAHWLVGRPTAEIGICPQDWTLL